jgi:hypothetical protein
MDAMRRFTATATMALFLFTTISGAGAAEDLKLRPGVSFTQDIDNGFPIVATDIDDTKIESGKPTLLFFGASGDLNTNRQAKRLVDLSHKTNAKEVKFIVIDVDHATTDDAKKLIKTYYQGYIPCQVILDKNGKKTWSQVGEVEQGVVKNQLSKVE